MTKPIKLKKTKEATDAETLIGQFFKPDEIWTGGGENLEGKWVVLSPRVMSEKCLTRGNLLWKVTGGFGCKPFGMGTAIFAICFEDGESARWNRRDVFGIFVGDPSTFPKRKFDITVVKVTRQAKKVEVEAVNVAEAKLLAKNAVEFSPTDHTFSEILTVEWALLP